MSKKLNKDLNSIKQKISNLLKEENKLMEELPNLLSAPMIPASFSWIYKTCGQPNCKCQKGEKHGPYPTIQIKIDNKHKLRMVRKKDSAEVEKKVKKYKKYQDGLAKINKINTEINNLLKEIRDENLEEYI